ncbi:MAG: succinate dehydrogenase, hydrophobic membrane anchor protein [Devosia sp.]|nr:succinate dehydrogenase, hydrophobic membrane anchor protein [Devosia sp.]
MSELSQKTIATPTTHYGSGRAANWNFIVQRATGLLNVFFTLFFIWLVVRLAGAGVDAMGEMLANPIVALVTALMIISVALHMRIGMLEVIEDYVSDERLNRLALLANWAFCIVVAVVTLAALAKLVFWG